MNYLRTISAPRLRGKTVLVRVDLNVSEGELPALRRGLKKGQLPIRLTAILPTIVWLHERGAKVVLMSHRGRPKLRHGLSRENLRAFSLAPIARILSSLLKLRVTFVPFSSGGTRPSFARIADAVERVPHGGVCLLENLRFFRGEETNDRRFAKELARLGDFYVNDAFAVSHRDAASVSAITRFLPSYGGLLLEREIVNLSKVMEKPKHPLVIILGGAKAHDKIGVVDNFYKIADTFLLGGGIANTLFVAQGLPVGSSVYDHESAMQKMIWRYRDKMAAPVDVAVKGSAICDIGPRTVDAYAKVIARAKTIIWNGPMGLIEEKKFRKGTEEIARAVLHSHAFTIIGGGETTVMTQETAERFALPLAKRNNFLSTGGGAMLAYLAGEKLPGIVALNRGLTRTIRRHTQKKMLS